MSDQKPDVLMKNGESTSGPLDEPVSGNSLVAASTKVDKDGIGGKRSEGHSRRARTAQQASKPKEQLDQANSVSLETPSRPCSPHETIDKLKSKLMAATETLKIDAKRISQLEEELSQSKTSLKTTKPQFEESQSTCGIMQDRINALGEELNETREQVFRLQPFRENITQSDALADYIAICHSVKSWIGTRLNSALDAGRIIGTKLHLPLARKLISLMTDSGINGTVYLETDEHNIIAIVMQFLRIEIFEKEFYGAVDDGHMDFLFHIEKNMRNLNPRRDRESRRSWRSETLYALVHSAAFRRREDERIKTLSNELLNIVSMIDNSLRNEECVSSLENKIIVPAVSLARQLHLSHSEFFVRFSGYNHETDPQMLEHFDCINLLENGKPVKLDGKGQEISRGSVKYLFDILPGFYCRTFKQDIIEDKVLKKPQVLVMVTKPGQVEHPSTIHLGEERTILGSIYESLPKPRRIRKD